MNSRRRNRRVTIEQRSTSQDSIGQPVETWTTLATVYANVRYLNGVETIKAGATTSLTKVSIGIGRRTDVTSAMRVGMGATKFQIQSVLPDEEDKDGLYLACEVIS